VPLLLQYLIDQAEVPAKSASSVKPSTRRPAKA
jgi:hypothetical protein